MYDHNPNKLLATLISLSLSLSLFKKFGYVIFLKDSANCKPSSPSLTSLAHQTLSLSLNKRRDYLKKEEEDLNCTILKSSPTSSSSSMSSAGSSYHLCQAHSPPRNGTEKHRQTDRQSFGEEEGGPRQTLRRAATKWGKNKNSKLQREGERGWVGR